MAIIFHLDMDAFFVSCELLRRPELEGQPVVVGADPKKGRGRGVVSTCSYEAREFGVRSGLPISTAYRLCPGCVFLPVDYQYYVEMSRKIFSLLKNSTDKVEQVGIDEAFFTAGAGSYAEAEKAAKYIKRSVKKKTGLTCSIGIGPNKSIAKIASDHEKPDGLTVVRSPKKFLAPLGVRKLHGIGPKTERALKLLGINTIGDIAGRKERYMADRFGKWGLHMHALANGLGEETLSEDRGAKSISRERTFEIDTDDKKAIEGAIRELSGYLFGVVSQHNVSFRSVCVKVRFSGFETHTRQVSLKRPSASLETITENALHLASSFMGGKKIRLIGVKLSGFSGKQIGIKKFLQAAK